MSNKSLGTKFEIRFAEEMRKKGYWVHLLQQSTFGQPADIIASRNNKVFLIDCKVCSNDRFPLSRIEDNQELAMDRWIRVGNTTPWFALEFSDGEIYVLSYNLMMYLKSVNTTSVSKGEAKALGYTLEAWFYVINSQQ